MKTTIVKISEVKQNPNNPRTIRDDKFERLVTSIKAFPEMLNIRPIVVNNDMVVLGGNMRLKACREAGIKQVPIIVADELTEAQQREFIIKDNVSGGEWDWSALTSEWDTEQLEEWGLDIPEFETDKTLEAVEDDYEMPDEIQTDIVLGDLFEIGEHRLLCGDSTDSDQVSKLMNGQKADMVFTDPPYGINFQSNFRDKTPQFSKIENDDKILDIAPILLTNIKIDCAAYVCTRWDLYHEWFSQISSVFDIKNCVVWYKKGGGLGDLVNSYAPNHEFIIVGHNGKAKLKGKREADVWEIGKDGVNDYRHPTQKPVELSSFAITNHSKKGDIVLDLFLGSGSTAAAAHQLKRKCYGMELDPKYCQVIVDRMLKLDHTLQIKRNGQAYTKTDELQTYGVSA